MDPSDESGMNPAGNHHPALGIDYGDARIGVAASDPLGILAHPVETIDQRSGNAISRIAELAALRGAKTIVLGLPLRMDGSEGDSARKARAFAATLSTQLDGIPVVMQDETLTTATAAAKLHEAGRNARQQKSVIDQAAAVEILRSWMDTLPGNDPDLTNAPDPEFDPPRNRHRSRRQRR